ncbi:hypothetical protein H8K33_00960 [Undibacterium amnicola]|uniref:Uncharacterized protein n=1 Tax=Undibacterium amnicola TaxID=1834038 RepID=A0ABR6XKN1_9BURK|nr:hypothetical protein [Undibacterium amnicola]MBC3830072.1 hypothetical protein [Undibacterium amnicola]
MTIPTKGARRIVVNAIEYRWTVRSKPTYCQGAFGNDMTAAVELATEPGQVLCITFPWMRCDSWIGNPEIPVTPKDIEACIKGALQRGWLPQKLGSAFKYIHETKT